MVPAAVMKQWQIELYEKFNLNWPIYTGGKLQWYAPGTDGVPTVRAVASDRWHQEPVVLTSSHLMRRKERQVALLEDATPWDLIVLDEAHHARRRGAGGPAESGANQLLRLMRRLKDRTEGLVLLTATPMQVHPVELWDLLDLLGLPSEWTPDAFVEFFEYAERADVTPGAFERMARLFQAAERSSGFHADPAGSESHRVIPAQGEEGAPGTQGSCRDSTATVDSARAGDSAPIDEGPHTGASARIPAHA